MPQGTPINHNFVTEDIELSVLNAAYRSTQGLTVTTEATDHNLYRRQ